MAKFIYRGMFPGKSEEIDTFDEMAGQLSDDEGFRDKSEYDNGDPNWSSNPERAIMYSNFPSEDYLIMVADEAVLGEDAQQIRMQGEEQYFVPELGMEDMDEILVPPEKEEAVIDILGTEYESLISSYEFEGTSIEKKQEMEEILVNR